MGKSQAPKGKKRQADFQKVKLKVGKKLPKGQNVTNTSFKTRNIQIVQQIKTDSGLPSTHRKLTITELFSKCQHYNMNVRREGVIGMRELMMSFPNMLTSNLPSIIEKTLPLMTDRDCNVRQATLKLFKHIFPLISTNQIEPFFPVLSAHLCCAMTHIQEDVQLDSLDMFDILLETYPLLIGNTSDQLLHNFVEQITKQRSMDMKGKNTMSLATTPDSVLSVQKWRSSILSRVQKLLSALLEWKFSGKIVVKEPHVYVDSKHIPSQFPSYVQHSWTQAGYKLQNMDVEMVSTKCRKLSDFATTLIPLLIHCWVECCSSKGYSKKVADNLVSAESVPIMYHVMKILHLLGLCVERERHINDGIVESGYICGGYEADFCKYFLDHFPYGVQENLNQKKKKKESNLISADSLNLTVCEVMCLLTSGKTSMKSKQHIQDTVGQYLSTCLESDDLGLELSKILIQVVRRFCHAHSNQDWSVIILENAVERYLRVHPLSTEKRLYLELFCEILLDSHTASSIKQDTADRFFKSLPELLLRVYNDKLQTALIVANIMRRAASHKCLPLIQVLDDSLLKLLDDGELFSQSNEALQRCVLEMLNWIPVFSRPLLSSMIKVCRHTNVSTANCNYLLSIFQYRFCDIAQKEMENGNTVRVMSDFLSFVLSLLVDLGDGDLPMAFSSPFTCLRSADYFHRHTELVKKCLMMVDCMPDAQPIEQIICSHWKNLISSEGFVSLTTAYSLLQCQQHFQSVRSLTEASVKVCLSTAQGLISMAAADTSLIPVAIHMWTTLTDSLVDNMFLLGKFLDAVSNSLSNSNLEACQTLLAAVVCILQDHTEVLTEETVGKQLLQIGNLVKSLHSEISETKAWTDFSYVCSIVELNRSGTTSHQ